MQFKNKNGVSLITLIITIVVIIILTTITMQLTSRVPDEAHYTKYMQVMKNVQTGVENIKILNSKNGTDEEDLTKGFKKVYLQNVPENFVSFGGNEELTGYLVDMKLIDYEDAEYGRKYNKVSGDKDNPLKFGDIKYDAYVFDANWNVYYLKGLNYKGSMNYSL